MIDLIGDVHGHADELEELLLILGYSKIAKHYSHTNRKVLFIGDYIDRGQKNRETLQIVKEMVDNGSAIALMGNHEYNAICFHKKDKINGGHLREHSIKNILQHYDTLEQFKNRQDEYEMFIEWFKTLPLFYETETFRAVHACWDHKSIAYLKKYLKDNRLTDDLIRQSEIKKGELHAAIEITLKGKEIPLPENLSFKDNDGNIRKDIRIKWWENTSGITYDEISVQTIDGLTNEKVDPLIIRDLDAYKKDEKNVFFGHYWLKDNAPSLLKENVCCLDYSIAKDGSLVAYSLDDELVLDNGKFTHVDKI
jgi:hypothetical protein